VSWALAFAIQHNVMLSTKVGKVLSRCDDDCIAIQALDCSRKGLFQKPLSTKQFSKILKDVDLDGEHWLLGYEAARQAFLPDSVTAVHSNGLFGELLKGDVTFYRPPTPLYANVVHPGGAPEWVVAKWLAAIEAKAAAPKRQEQPQGHQPIPTEGAGAPSKETVSTQPKMLGLLADDLQRLKKRPRSKEETVLELLNIGPLHFDSTAGDAEGYGH
jgi:hypothetical protein